MQKDSIIKILLVVLIVMSACFLTYALTMSSQNAKTFERVNLSSTCSLELPKIDFDVQNSSFGGSYGDVSTHTEGRNYISNDLIITYVKTVDNTGISSSGVYSGSSQMNMGHSDWYSREVTNLETGETILVSGKDKQMVDHIADSIIFSSGKKVENNNTAADVSKVTNNNTNSSKNQANNNPNNGQSNNVNPSPSPTPTPEPTPEPSQGNNT